MNIEDSCISCIDTSWSYQLAKRMEKEKTNPVLGYRTAGSAAETATGDMLYEEMKRIGLTDVTRDTFTLDGWEFEKAVLKFTDNSGLEHTFQMGGYQTNFETNGFQNYDLVYLGKGTTADYEGVNVKGKLVMVEINQRDEWWISFPVYQAYLRGAAALIAVQANGYGEIAETALNAQDIAGPDFAPAFSLSQADARILKAALQDKISAQKNNTTDSEHIQNASEPDSVFLRNHSLKVSLDARSRVIPDTKASNIVGKIQGTETDSMIVLSAHYDSYFDGFQDDNAAIAMMLGIARALVKGGYKPAHTLVFCAMAAEEWGIIDSKYDWSTGAYNQVFRVHPDWQGKVIADLNFELPAHAHNTQDAIRCTYEYADFIRQFTDSLTVPKEAYPDGITVLSPIETWSDDFSMAIAGIPSTVNDFSAGPFMQNYYHSQYDNQDVYEEEVYKFHHEFYLRLLLAIDSLALPPMDFGRALAGSIESLDLDLCMQTGANGVLLLEKTEEAKKAAAILSEQVRRFNSIPEEKRDWKKADAITEKLLGVFRKSQDYLVRLDWDDNVIFPQQAVQNNLYALKEAMEYLEKGEIAPALESFYSIDNNCYAFQFEREVFYHFTEYIMKQSPDRLMWGKGRIIHHENLYDLVESLKEKKPGDSLEAEKQSLREAWERQKQYYVDDIGYLIRTAEKLTDLICEVSDMFEKGTE